jgi:hypothetical protein
MFREQSADDQKPCDQQEDSPQAGRPFHRFANKEIKKKRLHGARSRPMSLLTSFSSGVASRYWLVFRCAQIVLAHRAAAAAQDRPAS